MLAVLVATGALALSRDADAFAVKRSRTGAFVHWDEPTVTYSFDPSVAANVPEAIDAARHAMGSWSGTVGAPELQGLDASVVPGAPTKPTLDHKNGIFFMPNGYAPAGKALAITVLTYDNATGQILDADIIVNGVYKFAVLDPTKSSSSVIPGELPQTSVDGTAHPSNTDAVTHVDEGSVAPDNIYDLHHVFAHELGHSLGMNDELSRSDALMYRYTAPNNTTLRAPAGDDIQGLAELYSTQLKGAGGGCQSSTIAAKKPTSSASQLAMFGTLGFLLFLVLRGRGDRRARFAFVAAAAIATYAMLPKVEARANTTAEAQGQARAKVLTTSVAMEDGLFKTSYQLAVMACRATSCPKLATGVAWGGVAGNIRQEVGGQLAPESGEDVDVSFDSVAGALAPLSTPLGQSSQTATVRVVTSAN